MHDRLDWRWRCTRKGGGGADGDRLGGNECSQCEQTCSLHIVFMLFLLQELYDRVYTRLVNIGYFSVSHKDKHKRYIKTKKLFFFIVLFMGKEKLANFK